MRKHKTYHKLNRELYSDAQLILLGEQAVDLTDRGIPTYRVSRKSACSELVDDDAMPLAREGSDYGVVGLVWRGQLSL